MYDQRLHENCFACGENNPDGLRLKFTADSEGKVSSEFVIARQYQGYDNMTHGGIIATILDCAMVHCLFARGVSAVTVEMNIRYRHPVETGVTTQAGAWLESQSHGMFCLKANISQNGQVKATAQARFYQSQPQE